MKKIANKTKRSPILLQVLLTAGLSTQVNADTSKLTEEKLIKLAKTESIFLHSIMAENNGAQVKTAMFQEKFSPYLSSSFKSDFSNEPGMTSPSPDSTTTNTLSVGYMQNFKSGLKLSGGIYSADSDFTDFSADSYSIQGANLALEIDLWKNALGRLEKKLEASSMADSIKANEILKLKKNEHVQSIRSLYWTVVANEELQKLRNKIIDSADRQKKQAQRQKKLYVSDKSDVTRFSALKEGQKSALIMLQYQREQLDSSFRKLFPSMRGKELNFHTPNLDKAADSVMECINEVAKNKMPPLKATSWVKVIKAAEVSSDMRLATNRLHTSPDLKLSTSYGVSNHDLTVSGSDALEDDPYNKTSVELTLNYPLGSANNNTQKWQNYAIKEAKLAEVENYKTTIASTHEQTLRLIRLLNQALKSQAEVNKLNQTNLKLAREKFNRAELPLINLINDETTYLTGKISEIETKLLVVNTLLDYLKVFDRYECSFNKL